MGFGRPKVRRGMVRVISRRFLLVALGAALLLGLAAASNLGPGFPTALPLPPISPAVAAPYPTAFSVVSVRGGPDTVRMSVTVDVKNAGGPFAGWLEVSGAERRVLVAVDVEAGSSRLVTGAYPVDNRSTVRMRLLDSAEAPVSAWVSATLDYTTHALVVGDRRAEVAAAVSQTGWLNVDQSPALPSEPGGLDRYAYLVVSGADGMTPGSASVGAEAAWDAVRSWVSSGGILVAVAPSGLPEEVTGGVLEAAFGSPRTLEAVSALTVVTSVGVGQQGAPPLPAGTVVSPVESAGAPYTVALDDGTVLLAGTRLARGMVLFVGVEPAGVDTRDAEGVRFFWENLVISAPRDVTFAGSPHAGSPYAGSPWTDPPHLFITGRVPSLLATGLAALLYTFVVGVGFFVLLRRLGRRDAVWWVVPAAVLVTTFAVLGAGLAARGARQEVLARRLVSLVAGGPSASESLSVGVYAPFGVRFAVVPPGGFAPGSLEGYDSGFAGAYTIRDSSARGGGVTVEDVRVAPGAGRTVTFSSGSGAGGREGDATGSGGVEYPLSWSKSVDGDMVRWTVTNSGPVVLRRPLLVGNGVFTLPDLAPGGSISFVAGVGPVTGEGVTAVTEEPPRPTSRDYLEWEAESRLRAEWAQYGPPGGYAAPAAVAVPPAGVGESKGFGIAAPVPRGFPVRLVAFAEDRGARSKLSGLSGGATVKGVVVYEVVLQ